jgi:4-hydroxy 2-oxovalerate aldolase
VNFQLLDCTLRDGGYLTDKHFSDNIMNGVIRGLTDAGVDYVEVGFLEDGEISIGESAVYKNAEMAKKYIPSNKKTTMYSAFADYSRYNVSCLEDYDGTSFDAVRECFFKEERVGAYGYCRNIIEKGYKLFMQPVGILRYSHRELLDLIDEVNAIRPHCLGIVDTFGSMYIDDLHTVFSLIHHNLDPNIKIGFHSHNNMQLSNALSQDFLNIAQNKRDVVVDSTLLGMGRGAGNAPTELIVQYMNAKLGKIYKLDIILDLIDSHIIGIKASNTWGYDIPMMLAGAYSSHVNNVKYLTDKAGLRSKDIRYILNKLNDNERNRYFYDRLEGLCFEYFNSEIDDSSDIRQLSGEVENRKILVIAPGSSAKIEADAIQEYVNLNKPIVISVNFIPANLTPDFLYFSNTKRYDYWKSDVVFPSIKKILTSNINNSLGGNNYFISYQRLVMSGYSNFDNSVIMLLRLLDMLPVDEIVLAGFDGYSANKNNFAVQDLEQAGGIDYMQRNVEIQRMFSDYMKSRNTKNVRFITKSRFSGEQA